MRVCRFGYRRRAGRLEDMLLPNAIPLQPNHCLPRSVLSMCLDKVSVLLTGISFDSFLVQNGHLLTPLQTKYQHWKSTASFKDLFVKELFHKRNRIVHFGKIDFSQPEAQMCFNLASTLWQILVAMDTHRRHELEAKHHVGTQSAS